MTNEQPQAAPEAKEPRRDAALMALILILCFWLGAVLSTRGQADTKLPVQKLTHEAGGDARFVYSADGHFVAVLGSNGTVRLYDRVKGKVVSAMQGEAPYRKAALSPTGSHLAAEKIDGSVVLFDLFHRHGPATLAGAGKAATALGFVEGHTLVHVNEDGKGSVYDVAKAMHDLAPKAAPAEKDDHAGHGH